MRFSVSFTAPVFASPSSHLLTCSRPSLRLSRRHEALDRPDVSLAKPDLDIAERPSRAESRGRKTDGNALAANTCPSWESSDLVSRPTEPPAKTRTSPNGSTSISESASGLWTSRSRSLGPAAGSRGRGRKTSILTFFSPLFYFFTTFDAATIRTTRLSRPHTASSRPTSLRVERRRWKRSTALGRIFFGMWVPFGEARVVCGLAKLGTGGGLNRSVRSVDVFPLSFGNSSWLKKNGVVQGWTRLEFLITEAALLYKKGSWCMLPRVSLQPDLLDPTFGIVLVARHRQ